MWLKLWFDGSITRNPGGQMAIGWVLKEVDRETRQERIIARFTNPVDGPVRTNNEAEWLALIDGTNHLATHLPEVEYLRIYGDSRIVIDSIKELLKYRSGAKKKLRKRNERMSQHRADFFDLIASVPGLRGWSVEWIPREENEEADAVSRVADKLHSRRKRNPKPVRSPHETHTKRPGPGRPRRNGCRGSAGRN